jgi:hypothetical protein
MIHTLREGYFQQTPRDEVKPAAPAAVEVGHATQPEAVKTESAKTEASQAEDNNNR